jgi:hypothetical protein
VPGTPGATGSQGPKGDTGATGATGPAGTTDWTGITNKPSTFPPTLPIAQSGVTNLPSDLALKANLASPIFTGDPQAPTPATADNDTSIATTAFVKAQSYATTASLPAPATVAPIIDGTATVGVATKYAREDHIHPTDTSRAPLANPVFTGDPKAPTPTAGDNDTSIATTAFVTTAVTAAGAAPSNANPVMDSIAAPGTSALYARGDHVHPTDTTRAALTQVVRYDTAQGLTLAQQKQARDNIAVSTVTAAGYLSFTSATQITLQPWMGDLIKISGVLFQIPGNITAANTGVFVNGTAGQNLAASTLYYVYLFNNAGTLTIDYSATAYATSATAGNVGMQIKSGDDTRTLIGLVFTNASSQIVLENVISWFNKKQRQVTASTNISTSGNICPVEFSTWADEAVFYSLVARMQNGTAQGALVLQLIIDGTGSGIQARNDAAGAASQSAVCISGARMLLVGRHVFTMGQTTTGTPSSGWQETYAMFRG